MCIVFSLELLFKRENNGRQKEKDVVKGCKYSSHSYLNLSLISELPGKDIFSLERVQKRDEQGRTKRPKGYECASRTMSGFKCIVFAVSLERINYPLSFENILTRIVICGLEVWWCV